jgi:large subunit ribosomal protein L32
MAVPRNRHSNARKNSKRSHMAKKPKNVSNCPNCGVLRMPHRMCPFCGHYANRAIISEGSSE